MPRNRLFFTAPIVLAIVIIGLFAVRSRGDNHANVDTGRSRNCPPVARADAVATKPGAPISIDVLANDTDPDGDPLVFQIRNTTGGDSTIDDGGTPTDAGDDRVLFTPADPPPPSATIAYQALDPDGALSESTVTVYINADGALPLDVRSEAVPTDNGSANGRCGSGTTSLTPSTTELTTSESTSPPVTDAGPTVTTKKSTHSTATTRPKSTTTTKPSTSSTTEAHSTTSTTHQTTTTQPQQTTTTKPDVCGPYPVDGSQQEKDDWIACEQAHQGG